MEEIQFLLASGELHLRIEAKHLGLENNAGYEVFFFVIFLVGLLVALVQGLVVF